LSVSGPAGGQRSDPNSTSLSLSLTWHAGTYSVSYSGPESVRPTWTYDQGIGDGYCQ